MSASNISQEFSRVYKSSVKKSKQSEMPPEMPLMPGFARNSILSASFRSVRSSSLSAITKYGSVIESSSFKSLNCRSGSLVPCPCRGPK